MGLPGEQILPGVREYQGLRCIFHEDRYRETCEGRATVPLSKVEGSLGTRPSKNRKGGSGKSAGVEVYTAPGMQAHFRLAFD